MQKYSSFLKWRNFRIAGILFGIFIFFSFIFIGNLSAEKSSETMGNKMDYVPGEIIVKFKENVALENIDLSSINTIESESEIESIEKAFHNDYKKSKKMKDIETNSPDLSNIYKIKLSKGKDVKKVVKDLLKNPDVEYAEPNYIYNTLATPNDPSFSSQWAHQNMQSELAWNTEKGNESVVIAILDTGVDWNHPDLAANIWENPGEILDGNDTDGNGFIDDIRGWDFVANGGSCYPGEDCDTRDNDPMDFHGHGTHCSGISAAATNNGIGIAGICWNCEIMAVRAGFTAPDGNGGLSTIDIADGLYYSADNGADVISMSFGGPYSTTIKDAIDYADSLGVVLVGAAGNDYSRFISYPAGYDNVISVSASDSNDEKAYFSNYGSWVDVAAPGLDIYSTLFDDTYVSWSGTSMATPYVAGLSGLILSKNPTFTNEEVKSLLKSSTDPVNWANYMGVGRINAYKAIQINSISIADLDYSLDDSAVNGTIDIPGTATGANFTNYVLYHGEGEYPSSWTEIYNSNVPVVDGILYSGFDTTALNDGKYTIKLEVIDSNGQVTEDRTIISLNSVEITNPYSNDIYRLGDSINVSGLIYNPFLNFSVEYGLGSNPVEWFSSGIVLANGGFPPIINESMATWDTSYISSEGYYSLRISINYEGRQEIRYIKDIFLDPTLKEGWPVRIPWGTDLVSSGPVTEAEYFTFNGLNDKNRGMSLTREEMENPDGDNHLSVTYYWPGFLAPLMSDIDNDGLDEIIVNSGGNPPRLYVYKQDGSPMDGWPVQVGTYPMAGGNAPVPVLDDIDNDGFDELITFNLNLYDPTSELHAFNHDGSIVTGFPVSVPRMAKIEFVIEDLDNDGQKEILIQQASGTNRKMVIVSGNGNILYEWGLTDVTWAATSQSSPAVGNFDGDPDFEIVSAAPAEEAGGIWENGEYMGMNNTGSVHVYDMDGSILPGWPTLTDGVIFSSPAVGDINNDGHLEIVVGLNSRESTDGGIIAFDKSGNILPGWPVEVGSSFYSSPALADLDGDNDLEIVMGGFGGGTFIYHHDGSPLSGWSSYSKAGDGYSPTVGDINSDGSLDIIVSFGDLYAYNLDGTEVAGFPKLTEFGQAPGTFSDIDNDGKIEIAGSSNDDRDNENGRSKLRASIYVWNLEGDYNIDNVAWPTFQHDLQQTGLYGPASECPDNDGDGYTDNSCGGTDCDDGNPDINPGEIEICNGIDDNCDTQVDEGYPLSTYYRDADSDSYGNDADNLVTCSNPVGYVLDNSDCDDADASTYPMAIEICDGRDNQCPGDPGYGQIDESCVTGSVCPSGCPFSSIQAAVDASSNGDTITVLPGTYYENVNIYKSVNLEGAGHGVTTVIPVDIQDPIFEVTADDVSISGFSLKGNSGGWSSGLYIEASNNCNIFENNISENTLGIYLEQSSNNIIANNVWQGNEYDGLLLLFSHHNTISENDGQKNGYGIAVGDSDYNTISGNTFSYSQWEGMVFRNSTNSQVDNNIISFNGADGIRLMTFEQEITRDNSFYRNHIYSNDGYGIYFEETGLNTFYDNFLNNSANFMFYGILQVNDWNVPLQPGMNIVGGSYLGGNFWAKPDGTGFSQTCLDLNLDEICDSAYSLASGNVDNLPLILVGDPCWDLDMDGYTDAVCGGTDCDDGDPDIYPGAPEICDSQDNQCPGDIGYGQVDEGDVCQSCAINFPDVPEGHWAHSYIEYLFCNGIVNGYPDGTFQPANFITRGQFAKMIVNANGIPEYYPPTPTFSDVPLDHWAYGYVEAAVQAGIISGYTDGTFRPGNQVTRAQISAMIARSRGWTYSGGLEDFTDVPPTHWAYDNIMSMKEKGIIGGYPDGTFLPVNQATRGQNSKMIANMMQTP